MTALRRTRPALVAGAAALALAACGAQQPQPPVLQARTISNALTSIASSCGEAYRRREFTPGDDLRSLEASASSSARQLVAIASRHPAWIFQGKTLVGSSISHARTCGRVRCRAPPPCCHVTQPLRRPRLRWSRLSSRRQPLSPLAAHSGLGMKGRALLPHGRARVDIVDDADAVASRGLGRVERPISDLEALFVVEQLGRLALTPKDIVTARPP